MHEENTRQQEYLQKTVTSLQRRVIKDQGLHRADNVRIMQENVTLLKEINQLRKDLTSVRQTEKISEMAIKSLARNKK